MKFYYDDNGTPIMLDYNGTLYYYITNLQGDVVGIADNYGVGATYRYDAWGNIIASDSASNVLNNAMTDNPLRYRGYIYDAETGFYYLQSRYYDPAIGRFINADGYVSTGTGFIGYNMYAYCNNNPVNYIDPNGENALSGFLCSNPYTAIVGIAILLISLVVVVTTTSSEPIVWPEISLPKIEEKVEEKVEDKAIEKQDNQSIYYGIDCRSNTWKVVTDAMTFEEAISWTNVTATSNVFGRDAPWGIYTKNEQDAILYMTSLQPGRPLYGPEASDGGYPHYHYGDNKRMFYRYKHFHAWYGEING